MTSDNAAVRREVSGDVTMPMRLVRDEPDVVLDDVRADGAENEASVLSDLHHQGAAVAASNSGRRRKARKPMSSKSQVIAVPEFGASEADPSDVEGVDAERVPTDRTDAERHQAPPEADGASSHDPAVEDGTSAGDSTTLVEDMTDGAIAPQELPDPVEGDDDAGSPDAQVNLGTLEALLMSTHHPLTPARLNELLEVGSIKAIRAAVQTLNDAYEQTGRSFRIEQVAGGYQILTMPEHGEALRRLHQKEADAKLTKAALETLSIIAYKQPILRADVEAIRGVACGEAIRGLMEKHLVKIAGRAEEPGRPILYGTTKRFLELFGLNSLKDLPKPEEFKPLG
jgi:segregation and condensation protein B